MRITRSLLAAKSQHRRAERPPSSVILRRALHDRAVRSAKSEPLERRDPRVRPNSRCRKSARWASSKMKCPPSMGFKRLDPPRGNCRRALRPPMEPRQASRLPDRYCEWRLCRQLCHAMRVDNEFLRRSVVVVLDSRQESASVDAGAAGKSSGNAATGKKAPPP